MQRDIDLRGLFDALRRPWKDRGRNCSSGNVNICCPFCPDDHGFHMAISEHLNGAFYCYRRPHQHSGRNLRAVLNRLGVERFEAQRMIESFAGRMRAEIIKEAPPEPSITHKRWAHFRPLEESDKHLTYLEGRGFPDPANVAMKYDLRFASVGTWAQRLLIPMKQMEQTIAWTGRCVRGKNDPKYLTEHNGHEGLIYLPRSCRDIMIICEGPLDALKIAAGSEGLPISALALTGKQLNAERLWHVLQASRRASKIILCLDSDTGTSERSRMTAELSGAFFGRSVSRAKLPDGYKDAGEIPLPDARRWLAQAFA